MTSDFISPATTMINPTDLAARLAQSVRASGNQRAFAQSCGISEQYLSDMLHGRREVGEPVLRALGYRRVTLYAPVER